MEKFDTRWSHIEVPENVWQLLHNYDWPGNVRELQNILERALVLSDGHRLTLDLINLPQDSKPPYNSKHNILDNMQNPIMNNLQHYEAEMLRDILQRNNWNISKTSIELGVSRTTLYRKIGVYGLRKPE
jgi:transcriptional regulator of acetoin/glycerol metabolism